ncbi:YhgE/Pip domain-containing protein [Weissella viridescens]|uniref:YhgE/Pip domain-containing protein n=1 Tax=Weissella viridescens TaxID=1629 RepID=UPI001C7D507C|nr:YhgE/Pip domain-containing protein [Weissella viridescens]MBX4173454.1 YhgE/Pip domain-containing protein [Weissella viridescens]
MLKAEWQYLKKHRFMMLVVSVLCFLPALYAVPFLGSLWNTYGNVDELPVAVVNHDQPVKYHKQTVDVGNQLVHELKQSKDLDFNFTNSKQAQRGLKDGKYYMVMTIPENFSKDATTLLDKHPRKMQLDYATSSGHSFIGGKLSESAANKMQQRVSESVTEAYTKAMFSEIKEAGDGLGKAADGSQKLADGSGKIKNGQQQLADGLSTLAQSSLTFGAGAQKLDVGLKQYVDGVGQAGQGNQAVGQGLQQMQGQLPAFNQGVSALSAGQSQLSDGLGASLNGQRQLTDGLSQAQAGQTKLHNGVQDYTDAVSQVTAGSEQVTKGLVALQDATQKGQLDPKKINQVKSDLTDLERIINEAKAKQGAAPDARTVTQKIDSSLTALAEMQKISAGRDAHVNAAIDQTAKEQKLTPEQTQALKQSVQASQASDQAQMDAQVAVLQKNTTDLQEAIAPMVKSLAENQDTLTRIAQHAQGLPAEMPAIEQQVTQLQALPSAVNKLTDGSKQVTGGLQQLSQKSGELNQGSSQLLSAQNSLLAGSQQLTDGNAKTLSGSQQLNAGVNQMANQMAPLQNGVAQLVAGNGKVQTGLSTLQNKGGELTQGSSQLANGSTQLQDGSQRLNQGAQQMGPALNQVQQGNQKLSDQLDQATKRVNDLPANKRTYAQMAQPAKTKHQERDQVPNNGTGMAPYMFSVGLFVGMLGINLMIDLVQPRTTIYALWRWVGSKLVILLGIATMMAIVLFFLSKWLLGMTYVDGPATLGLLILIAWMDALLVTAINLWFGRAGSFVSVVLLVAQLSLSAGTYPIQLSPEIYQKLHAWVPMTYTVNGLRQTMMIGQAPTQAVYVMLGIMLVSLVAMILFYIRQHRHGFNLISE